MRFSGGIRYVGFRELIVRCVDNGLDICGDLSFTDELLSSLVPTTLASENVEGTYFRPRERVVARVGADLHAAARVG